MQVLLLTGLWALLLQGGMLFFMRRYRRRWSPFRQRLVAGLFLPAAVAAMAVRMEFASQACPESAPKDCNHVAAVFAWQMVGALLLAALLLWLIGRVRGRR
jgi:hypothetical protein